MDYGYGDNYNEGGFNTDAQYTSYDASQLRPQTRSLLAPVTIKQINDATKPVPDGEFTVNNVSLNMVSFIGVVRKVEHNPSASTITIEDGTGSVEIKKWADDKVATAAEEAEKYSAWENKYVYVTGALKEFNKKKSVQHATITEITDHNEVLYHMLYSVQNHLGALGLLKTAAAPKQEGLFVDQNGGGADVSDRILSIISSASANMPQGVPVTWIAESVGLTVGEVEQQCHLLSEQGRVFSGYDDSSYLSI